jgi:WhiB family redox-sensing transcriptional regulator
MTRDTIGAAHVNGRPDPRSAALDVLGLSVPEWMLDAPCASIDPELFFPDKGGSARAARRICGGCEVRAKCLDYAVEIESTPGSQSYTTGIYGGLSAKERRPLVRERKAAS